MEAVPQARDLEALLAESEWIGALASGLLGDTHHAEDLAQEVHLAALRSSPACGESSRPWLATVARNAARMLHRSEGTRTARESDRAREQAEAQASAPEELLANLETQELVSRLVRELPAEFSDVILLSFYEGHSSEHIARLRGIPAGTVRWRKMRALELLRERLDSHHDGDRNAWSAALLPLTAPGWQSSAKLATSGGALAGLLAPWMAMSLSLKLISLALVACALLLVPFFDDAEGDLKAGVETARVDSAPQSPVGEHEPANAEPLLEQVEPTPRVAVESGVAASLDDNALPVTRIRLRVVDSQERAVPGATVKPSLSLAMQAAHQSLLEELGPLKLANLQADLARTTGPDGVVEWETDLLRHDGLVDFLANGPRFGSGSIAVALEVGGDVDLGDLVLLSGGGVEGRISDTNGEALARIIVALGPAELSPDGSAPPSLDNFGLLDWELGTTRSDSKGDYHLDGVAPGEYRAYAKSSMEGEVAWSEAFSVVAESLVEGADLRCEAVERVAPARLLVLGADGEPLSSARVTMRGATYSRSGGVDDDGTTDFGQYSQIAGGSVEVSDESFVHGTVTESLPKTAQAMVIRMELAEVHEQQLTVLDRRGQPIEGATIKVTAPGRNRSWKPKGGAASLILPAAEGEIFNLFVEARGFQGWDQRELRVADLTEPWTVTLEDTGGLRGVVLAGGEPVPKAKLELYRHVAANVVEVKGDAVTRMNSLAIDDVRSDEDGRFQLYAAGDGALVLSVSARGYADTVVVLADYVGAQEPREIEIELKPAGSLSGMIFDHLGQAVPRAHLVLVHPYHELRRTRSRADGSYRFRRVPEGDWVLRAVEEFRDGFFSSRVEVPEGYDFPVNCSVLAEQEATHDLRLDDPRAASVRGRWSVSGADAGVFTAEISNAGGGLLGGDPFATRWERSTSLTNGEEFELNMPIGGDVDFELTATEMRAKLRRALSAEELPMQLDIDLELASLSLETPSWTMAGDGSETVYVEWSQDGWKMFLSLRPGADGHFAPAIVPAGELKLLWKAPGADEASSMELRIEVAESRELELR